MTDILLLLFLILLNGLLAMSEIAVVSARRSRLQKFSDDGFRSAQHALQLSQEPSAFLSTIQVGITVVGILSGAIGQGTLVAPLTEWFSHLPLVASHAETIALVVVVALLTYFSVVIGELVPKRLALLAPERIAMRVARPMQFLAGFARPLVYLFSASSSFVLKLLGARTSKDPVVTDDEINVLMEQGAEAGVFHESEQAIVSNVLRLDEQRIATIMTHRNEIYALDLEESESQLRAQIAACPYTRIVACRGGLENIVGILQTLDLLKAALSSEPLDIERYLRPPLYVPEGVSTTHLLENFRKARAQSALIVDEYGELEGLVTLTDVLTAIVGDVPSSNEDGDSDIVMREDGSWLLDGTVAIERLKQVAGIEEDFPGEHENLFNTVGGLIMYVLGRIPVVPDVFECVGYRFEVVDMDKNRVDKVLLKRLAPETLPTNTAA